MNAPGVSSSRIGKGTLGKHPGIGRVAFAAVAAFAIMYLVPFPVNGVFEALGWVELPQGASPAQFFLSVLVIKIGVAVARLLADTGARI